ncbi:DegV family protein [Aciduricibacillus chroicocephali]|uniref:DegV family protein n=1 Tax=Aciduricibacillus chroicocephali TaxID=3054939 RepID=A0ABY9KYQ9_9BACI|nr:DegV family protein [Bacillaceae bacterium 44XB]
MTIRILADSACDLPPERLAGLPVEVLPLTVQYDNAEYKDQVDISPETVYSAMRKGEIIKTAQVSLQTFLTIFQEAAKEDETLIYFAFSSGLSGTFSTAKLAEQQTKEKYPEADLHIIDTKCASLGYGLIVLKAGQMAAEGMDASEIIKHGIDQSARMEHIFTVDDLEFLYRGGRVSKTAAFIGTMLKIKPLLDMEDGKLVPREKIRGTKRVLGRMVEVMEERSHNLEGQTIAISHGDCRERAEQLAEMIRDKHNVKDIVIEMVGAVIGAHSGPGTLALFFLKD